jgi:methylglutaconyl-CoA hydratase
MPYRHLTTERDGAVERLTLNRPDVRNALNDELIAELTHWAARTREQRDVRVVVLAGAGSAFSAGADLAWMARTVSYTHEQNVKDAAAVARMFLALDTLPMPLVGRIQGAALGGGAGLAAVCDIVVAEEEAVFGFTEVRLGVIPAVISPFVLAKIGRSAARELFLTGARFSAGRAREIGLVHRVVARPALDEAVAHAVADIMAGGPEAVAAAKLLIRDVGSLRVEQAGAATSQAIAGRRVSVEGQEGLRAFLEKRKPHWADT